VIDATNPLTDLTLLSAICKPYLDMTYAVARRKHAMGTLSIKAFRLSGTRRGPLFVHNDDLHNLIQKRRTRAQAKPEQVNAEAAVVA
jgi:hypothetical protein